MMDSDNNCITNSHAQGIQAQAVSNRVSEDQGVANFGLVSLDMQPDSSI